MKWIILCLSLSLWLISTRLILSRFIHTATNCPTTSILKAKYYSIVNMYHSFFIQSLVCDKEVDCEITPCSIFSTLGEWIWSRVAHELINQASQERILELGYVLTSWFFCTPSQKLKPLFIFPIQIQLGEEGWVKYRCTFTYLRDRWKAKRKLAERLCFG